METSIHQLSALNPDMAQQISQLAFQLGYPNNHEDLLKRTTVILASPTNCVFVAQIGDQIVGWAQGFIAWRIESPLFVEISGLVVDQHHHQLGIGKNLVSAIQTWSKKQGVDNICVRCNVNRIESHRFYENIGFNKTKQQGVFTMEI